MSAVSSRLPRRCQTRASTNSQLPHWSEVTTGPRWARPSPSVAAALRDLVSWAADLAIRLTRDCPEDCVAIERVRSFACAWLAGESCPGVPIDDVLTTMAALLAGIDRDVGGTIPDEDERQAIGAAVCA